MRGGSDTSSPGTAPAPGPLQRAAHQNGAAGSLAVPAERGSTASGTASSGTAGASSPSGSATTLTAGLASASQSIVYTASIEIRAANVAATARRITGIVEAAGGYISAETAGSASPDRTGQMIGITLKIPVPGYDAVLAQLSSPTLGKQLGMHQQATDVTQQVANVSSLVTSE